MSIPKRKSHLAFNKLQDQVVIIDFNSSKQFHQVNELGSRIWELCDGKLTINQIIEVLFDEYEIDKKTLEEDVTNFMKELKENELLDY